MPYDHSKSQMANLEAAMAGLTKPHAPQPTTGPGAQARARHAAYLAEIAQITARNAARDAAKGKGRGYSDALGAHYRPADYISNMADDLEADGIAVIRTSYGFRLPTPEERAAAKTADIEAALATQAMERAA